MVDIERKFGIVCIPLPTPFPVGPVNVFLIKSDPPMLVDTGLRTDESYDALTAALAEYNLRIGDLGVIIVTHGHRDHMGQLGRLVEESGAETYAHPLVAKQGRQGADQGEARKQFYIDILHEFGVPDEIQEKANSLYDRFRAMAEPFTINHVFEDERPFLSYTAHYVPGHSPSDTLLVAKDESFTFVGDHVLTNTNPNPLLRRPEPGQPRAKSLVEYQASLKKTRGLKLGVCLPGHGDPFDDHVTVVDRILARHEKRSAQVLDLVKEGEDTPYRVSQRLFPKLPVENIHLGLSIAVGHLEVLEERGQVVSDRRNGVLHFPLA